MHLTAALYSSPRALIKFVRHTAVKPKKRKTPKGQRWVCKHSVWHKAAGRFIFRKDGEPFRFRVK